MYGGLGSVPANENRDICLRHKRRERDRADYWRNHTGGATFIPTSKRTVGHSEVTHPKRNGRDTDESTRAVESVKKRYRQPLQLPISVVGQERFAFSVSE